MWTDRRYPEFVRAWSWEMLGGADEGDPVDYLAQEGGVEFTIAAAWLFCPDTVEYRGGIFLKKRFIRENVDDWLETTDIISTQSVVNSTKIWSLFGDVESSAFEDESEFQLASAVGECWDGVLSKRYPDRRMRVHVNLDVDEGSSVGPSVTFWAPVESRDER